MEIRLTKTKAKVARGSQGGDLKWMSNHEPLTKRLSDATYVHLYDSDPLERVKVIKLGIAPTIVDEIALSMRMPKDKLILTLGLARSTIVRKKNEQKLLTSDESSRLLGISRLIGQVRSMVEQSGDASQFDAAAWVANWLEKPLPALSGMKPAELMDTSEGQAIVSQVVSRIQSGAYA